MTLLRVDTSGSLMSQQASTAKRTARGGRHSKKTPNINVVLSYKAGLDCHRDSPLDVKDFVVNELN